MCSFLTWLVMKIKPHWKFFTGAAAFVLLLAGCRDENPEVQPDIKLFDTTLGKVLADENGMTLYLFARDVSGDSKCTGGCLNNWPVFLKEGTLLPGDGLDASDFTTITRSDGTKQTTYKGWPLYYFNNDKAPGEVKGENVNNIWFVAKPDYTLMIAAGQLVGNDGKSYKSDYTEGTGETQYFVDGKGRTLYTFQNDRKEKNNFTREDFSNDGTWPIYTVEVDEVPSSLDKNLFKIINVYSRKQLTYKGWPLYYFGADGETKGSTKGVSVPVAGRWPVAQKEMQEASL